VQIFDQPCCGPSEAAKMAEFLTQRLNADEVTVEYHDLTSGGGQAVKVPGALVAHLTSGGRLPVIAVDGELVVTGMLPNLMDALDIANGKEVSRPLITLTATRTGGEACAPGCC